MLLKKSLILGTALLASGLISAQTTQRIPLYESFTSSTCPPCLPGNVHLEDLFAQPENDGKYTSLKYQMSWPGAGDPYYTLEGGTRRGFYGISGVPSLQIDGGFNDAPQSLDQAGMDAAYAEESIVELDVFYQVDETTNTVAVQISIKALQEIGSTGGLSMRVAIFEKLTTSNVKSNGETQFEHVMKKMLPSALGTFVGGFDANEIKTYDFNYTFNGNYTLPPDAGSPIDHAENHTVEEFSDLGVVVWLQKSTTRDVFQSAYGKQGTSSISEDNTDAITRLSVYPNPSKDLTNVVFTTLNESGDANVIITDNTGKVVYENLVANKGAQINSLEINTENFDNGIYFITVSNKQGDKTKKLSIIH